MAKPTKATKGSAAGASPRVVMSPAAEPVGRFAEVLAETRRAGMAIEPFEVTEGLTLYPPTEARTKKMDNAQAAYLLAQTTVASLVSTMQVPPDALEDPEARIAWSETQQKALLNAQKAAADADQAFNEALYGDTEVLQRVEEFFANRPGWEKVAFAEAVNAQFRRLPIDGKCQACGQEVDDGAAGESEGGSSGGSSTSGPSSSETSPITSTEPTPTNGSEGHDPGPSSSPTPTSLPA